MSTASSQPPKTTDALSWRNCIPFKAGILAIKLMDEAGQTTMAEIIRLGSRAVNRAHYEARTVERARLGLGPRTAGPSYPADEVTAESRGDLPNATVIFTPRNNRARRLVVGAFNLMDESGQAAMSAVIRAGGKAVNDAWRAERDRKMEELLFSGRLDLGAGRRRHSPDTDTNTTPTKENR